MRYGHEAAYEDSIHVAEHWVACKALKKDHPTSGGAKEEMVGGESQYSYRQYGWQEVTSSRW